MTMRKHRHRADPRWVVREFLASSGRYDARIKRELQAIRCHQRTLENLLRKRGKRAHRRLRGDIAYRRERIRGHQNSMRDLAQCRDAIRVLFELWLGRNRG